MKKFFIGAAAGAVMAASGTAMADDLDGIEYLGTINKYEFYGEYAEIQGKEYNPNGPKDFAVQFNINGGPENTTFRPTCDYLVNFPEDNEKTLLEQAAQHGLDAGNPKMQEKVRNIIQMAAFDCTPGS